MFRHQDYVPGGRPQCGGGKVHENAKFTRENEYHKFPRHDYEKHKICYWWPSRHTTHHRRTTPREQFKEIDFGGVFLYVLNFISFRRGGSNEKCPRVRLPEYSGYQRKEFECSTREVSKYYCGKQNKLLASTRRSTNKMQ